MPEESGPPAGSVLDSPHATHVTEEQIRRRIGGVDASRIQSNGNPAWDPPRDPLGGRTPSETKVVYRDIPIINTVTSWTVDQLRAAITSHLMGIFWASGQLADAVLGDDRVQATLSSRISGLFGREVIIRDSDEKSVRGSMAAKECREAWEEAWPKLATAAAMNEMGAYSILMGMQPGQLLWDTTVENWQPYLRPWHMRYTYWNWDVRRLIAISQDGSLPIMPGDGKWVLHAPYGDYRGWIRGTLRAIAEPWLMRRWAMRDWARYSEVHGIPIRKLKVPAAADEVQRDRFEAQAASLGSETSIMLPQGVDKQFSYDLEFAEPVDDSWQSFPGLIDRCDMSIVLAILFQNLTTEVKGGSFAATTAHMDIRQGGIQYDNVAWAWTIRQQIARVFAWLNFGDPALAPHTCWDVTPRDELAGNADQFQKFGTAVEVLARGGIKFTNEDDLRKFAAERFGLKGLPAIIIGEPPAASGGFGK